MAESFFASLKREPLGAVGPGDPHGPLGWPALGQGDHQGQPVSRDGPAILPLRLPLRAPLSSRQLSGLGEGLSENPLGRFVV